jgi:nucleoside-diphosphate-sugar epimerase
VTRHPSEASTPEASRTGRAVLVTGGTGFLGRAIVQQLQAAGHETCSLQRGGREAARTNAAVGDVRDPRSAARAVAGVDTVIHAAGLAHVFRRLNGDEFADINARGTETMARVARCAGVRQFVLISSVAVYGRPRRVATEDVPGRPVGRYATSKAEAERRAVAALAGSSVRLTILRLATVYGEGDRGNVQRLLELIARGYFVWVGQGENRKSLLHVDDAARGCVLSLSDSGTGVGTYNLAAPPVAVGAVVEALSSALGRRIPRLHIPAGMAVAAATAVRALVPGAGHQLHEALVKWLSDEVYPAGKFSSRFGFAPRISLAEGLRRQVEGWQESRRNGCRR